MFRNIVASHTFDAFKQRNWTSSIDGMPVNTSLGVLAPVPIGPNIVFENLQFQYRGGGLGSDVDLEPPHDPFRWFWLGVRPRLLQFVKRRTSKRKRRGKEEEQKKDGER